MTGTARHRIDRLAAANEDAVTLAALAATAVRIEPELLRRLRLLIPGADVGAETDLWSSDLLASASPLAISLDPDCAELLRGDPPASAGPRLRTRAAEVIETSHTGLHWSLRLEESVNMLMAQGGPGVARAERLLYAAIGELRSGGSDPGTDPVRVARWLLGALGRISPGLRATEAGVVAAVGAGARLDGRYSRPSRDSEAVDRWMPWLLDLANVEPRWVPIRFAAGVLTVNEPGPGTEAIQVPGTEPMVLHAAWHDGQVRHRRLEFGAGEVRRLRVTADRVELRDLTGAGFAVALPVRGRQAFRPADGLDFSGRRAALRPCLARDEERDRVVRSITHDGAGWLTLTGEAGIGKSVLLAAALDRLEEQGYAVADHFYGIQEQWDAPETVAASLMAKIRGAVTSPAGSRSWGPGRRRALLIANSDYHDPRLAGLRSIGDDAARLARALADPDLCGFEVELLADATRSSMTDRLAAFLRDAVPDDLTLLYIAAHTIDHGRTVFATADTDLDEPSRTGVRADDITDLAGGSVAGDLVAILDVRRIDTDSLGVAAPTMLGAPWLVLSANEGPLTSIVVDGLRSGEADLNYDGGISLDELGRFVRERLSTAATTSRQDISFSYGGRPILMARNPRAGVELSIPAEPRTAIPSRFLEEAAAVAPGIVIALDGPVGRSPAIPLAGPLPSGISVIATVNVPGTPHEIRLGAGRAVCRAIAAYHGETLTRAFGRPPGPDPLIARAREVPRRLMDIIEWAAGLPAGTARIPDIPPFDEMATDAFWSSVDASSLEALAAILVARPGCTVAEFAAAVPDGPAHLGILSKLRLVSLTGPAKAPDTVVAGSTRLLLDELGQRFPHLVREAHRRHAAAFPFAGPAGASDRQIDSLALHAVHSGSSALADSAVRCGGYLERRARTAGPGALLDDLSMLVDAAGGERRTAELLRRVVAALAPAIRDAPEFFVDIVSAGLAAERGVQLFEDATPALRVRLVSRMDDAESRTLRTGEVVAAIPSAGEIITVGREVRWYPGDRVTRYEGPMSGIVGAVRAGDRLAIVAESSLMLIPADRSRPGTDPGIPTMTSLSGETVLAGPDPRRTDFGPSRATAALGGSTIHIGLADGRILEFAAGNAEVLRRLVGHGGRITALAVTSGHLVSASADGTVRVWPAAGSAPASHVYRGHHAPVTALATPAAGWALSGDAKGRLRAWATGGGGEAAIPSAHAAPITRLLAADGVVVSADGDGLVMVWDWGAGQVVPVRRHQLPNGAAATRLAYAGGVVAAATATGTIHWMVPDRDTVLRTADVGGQVHELVFEPGGTLVVAHSGGLTGYPPVAADGGHRAALAVDDRGTLVLAGTPRGLATLVLGEGAITSLTPTRDAPAGAAFLAGGLAVATVDRSGRARLGSDEIEGGPFAGVAHGSRGCWLLARDGTISLVTASGPERWARWERSSEPTAIAADDAVLAVGYADGRVRIGNLDDSRTAREVAAAGGNVRDLAVAWEVAAAAGSVRDLAVAGPFVVGLADGGRLFRISAEGDAARIARHPTATGMTVTGARVVSCAADGTLRLWDIRTGKLLGVVAGTAPFHAVASPARPGTVVARDAADRLWFLDSPERTQA